MRRLVVLLALLLEESLSLGGVVVRQAVSFRRIGTTAATLPLRSTVLKLGTDDAESPNNKKNTANEQDVEALLASVSDAEALLACRAHLQRTNQLSEWSNGEFRKFKRRDNVEQAKQSDEIGFFWDNPDELVYYNRRKRPEYYYSTRRRTESEAESNSNYRTIEGTEYAIELPDNKEDEEKDEEIWETVLNSRSNVPSNDVQDKDDEEDVWENAHLMSEHDLSENTARSYYTLDDVTPSVSHTRRSNAAKRRFAKPEWKAAWYEKRWGDKVKSNKKQRRQLEERVHKLDGFLQHPELNKMTEEEISQAIQTYVISNQKRGAARRKTLQQRKEALQESMEAVITAANKNIVVTPPLSRDILFQTDPAILEEQRRKRSEQATRAYQQRLLAQTEQRNKSKNSKPSVRHSLPSQALTPADALERVQVALEQRAVDMSQLDADVRLVLEPAKLVNRKPVLCRILREFFGLRGKCVPPAANGDDSGDTLQFVTQSSIADLGALVLEQIRQGLNEDGTS